MHTPLRPGRELVDLSHAIEHGVVTYRGLPAPLICDHLSRTASRAHYAPGTEFHIGRIEMVGNTGTYVDAPFHRFALGKDLADLPLESLAELPGVLIEVPAGVRSIGAEILRSVDVAGRAVLFSTGWWRHYATERYFEGHPFLEAEAARVLREGGARLVGIDSLNIDDTADGARPVHTTLLGADIPIAEHLARLELLRGRAFRFSAVPVKVRAFGTFPVRAYASVEVDNTSSAAADMSGT